MPRKQKCFIVMIALLIGVSMVLSFLGGQHLIARDYRLIGLLMTVWGLIIWPLYALFATIGVNRLAMYLKIHDWREKQRTAWRRSIYWVPVGAFIAIQVLDVLFS